MFISKVNKSLQKWLGKDLFKGKTGAFEEACLELDA